jgi:threonine dehydrogenase-like Zn-dependent dehydrogenase
LQQSFIYNLASVVQGDAIIKVTSSAICGSDLHLYLNFMPGMEKNAIMGHEVSVKAAFINIEP